MKWMILYHIGLLAVFSSPIVGYYLSAEHSWITFSIFVLPLLIGGFIMFGLGLYKLIEDK